MRVKSEKSTLVKFVWNSYSNQATFSGKECTLVIGPLMVRFIVENVQSQRTTLWLETRAPFDLLGCVTGVQSQAEEDLWNLAGTLRSLCREWRG